MKRWHLLSLVLSAALFAVAVAVLPINSGRDSRTFAHTDTGTSHVELDMVQDAGGTWCNPVDTSNPVAHAEGETYKVAVCVSDLPATQELPAAGGPPSALQFTLTWNPQLNECVVPSFPITGDGTDVCAETDPNCLDSNPDANAAAAGGTIFNGTGLGTRWNCNISDVKPACNNTAGTAFLQCNMTSGTGTLTLPVGPDVSWPIAVVTLKAVHGGTDTLSLINTEVDDASLLHEVFCFGTCTIGDVFGATDNKSGSQAPTATSTATPTTVPPTPVYCASPGNATCTPTPKAFTKTPGPSPTATETPAAPPPPPPPPPPPSGPSGGQAPVVSPPNTGDGSGDLAWGKPLGLAIAVIGIVSLLSGGLYVRYARNR